MGNNENKQKELTLNFMRAELKGHEEKELLDWINSKPENKALFINNQQIVTEELLKNVALKTTKQWGNLSHRLKLSTHYNAKSRTTKRIGYIASIAAAFIIGLIIASYTPVLQNRGNQNTISQTFSTPNGARTHFKLPDGSVVWLNAGTQLTFSDFGSKDRQVALNGEAYFEVARDEKRPFIISTKFGKVKVFGTSFNVKAYYDDLFATTVESGLVSVSSNEPSEEVFIHPGEQAVLALNADHLCIKNVETQIFTCWKDGVLIFKKDALEDIVTKLERWYNVDIVLAPNMELKNYRFTGNIEMESLPEVLELIRITAPIKYSYDAKKRIVELEMKDLD